MEQVTSFSATLIQGLEGDTLAAAEAADKAIIDMSDNANKFGTDIGSIQNAYQGFAKNNYTMLDNLKLGYGGTAAEMARLINDSGVLGDAVEATASNVKDIPFDQVIEAIHVTQDKLKITGTTAAEAAGTFEGSMKSMQAAAKNVLGGIALGEDIKEPLAALAETVVTFVSQNLLPMLSNVVTALPDAIGAIFKALSADAGTITQTALDMITNFTSSLLQNLPVILSGIMDILQAVSEAILAYDWATTGSEILQGLITSITENLPHLIIMGLLMLQNLVDGIFQALPEIIAAIPEIISAFATTLTEHLPEIVRLGLDLLRSLIDGIVNNLPLIIEAMIQLINVNIQTIVENLPLFIEAAIEIILALISGIIQATPQLIAEFINLGASVSETIMNIDWIGLGVQLIGGIATGVMNGVGALVDAVKGAAQKALDTAKSALGIQSPSKVFRDDVGQMIDLGMAEGIEKYTNPIKQAMSGLSDMASNQFKAATELQYGNAYQTAEFAPAGMGDVTIPVYIGQTKFAQAVVNANQINNYRSGGR